MPKNAHKDVQSFAGWVSSYQHAHNLGVQSFAGWVIDRIDAEEGPSTLEELRAEISSEVARRFPRFDLEAEAQKHQRSER